MGALFDTLFVSYPDFLGHLKSGFEHWLSDFDSRIIISNSIKKLSAEQYSKILTKLPPSPMWKLESLLDFNSLMLLHETQKKSGKNYPINPQLLISDLKNESLFSHLIRNPDIELEGKVKDFLEKIVSPNQRIMCLLSMNPSNFSKYVNEDDFYTIINSPFYSLVLSVEQIKSVLLRENSEKYSKLLTDTVNRMSLDGHFMMSISRKFNRALGVQLQEIEGFDYYTLEYAKILSWDYYNNRRLDIEDGKLLIAKIWHGQSQPLNWMEKHDLKNYNNFYSKLRGEEIDPFYLGRLITDFDYKFSEELRKYLDSLFLTYGK